MFPQGVELRPLLRDGERFYALLLAVVVLEDPEVVLLHSGVTLVQPDAYPNFSDLPYLFGMLATLSSTGVQVCRGSAAGGADAQTQTHR